jgi:hypothetical protein
MYRLSLSSETNCYAKITDSDGRFIGSLGIGSMFGGVGSVVVHVPATASYRLVVEGHGKPWQSGLNRLPTDPGGDAERDLSWTGTGSIGSDPFLLKSGVVLLSVNSDTMHYARVLNATGWTVGSVWLQSYRGGTASQNLVIPSDGVYFLNVDGYGGNWTVAIAIPDWSSVPDGSSGLFLNGSEAAGSGPFVLGAGTVRLRFASEAPGIARLLDRRGTWIGSAGLSNRSGGDTASDFSILGGIYLLNVHDVTGPWNCSLVVTDPIIADPTPTPTPDTTGTIIRHGSVFGIRRYIVGGVPANPPAGTGVGTRPRSTYSSSPGLRGGDTEESRIPPTTRFVRWYPESRWKASG